jgi:DNA-binding CsgD family transcriptional regulator
MPGGIRKCESNPALPGIAARSQCEIIHGLFVGKVLDPSAAFTALRHRPESHPLHEASFDFEANGTPLRARLLGQRGSTQLLLVEKGQARTATPASSLASYRLTQREVEVLMWVARGKTNKDIVDILGMSPRTVNKHLEHIYVKLGVETRTAAAAFVNIDS